MVFIRFSVILLVVMGLYYVLIYRNLGNNTNGLQEAVLFEGLDEYPYIAYLPVHHGKVGESFPLILYLHDHAGSVNAGTTQVLNESPITFAASQIDFPFVIAAPLTTSQGWDLEKLTAFLETIVDQFAVDPTKIFITGIGDGGDMVWMMGVFFPERFAAIAPVAGTGDPKSAQQSLTDTPIWIFHGKQDEDVPAERSLLMVGALKSQHQHLNYTLYPGMGHDIGLEVYNAPLLYHWFMQDFLIDKQN